MPARKHLLLLVSLSIVGSMLLLLLNLPFPGRTANADTPAQLATDRCTRTANLPVRIPLDGVELRLCTSFIDAPQFAFPNPTDGAQVATAVDRSRGYREISITAVAFGLKPATEALPASGPGSGDLYRAILREYRRKRGANPSQGPNGTIFGKDVLSSLSIESLNVDGPEAKPIAIAEWTVEAGNRTWILRVSQELPVDKAAETTAWAALTAAEGTELESSNLSQPSSSRAAAGSLWPGSSSVLPHAEAPEAITAGLPSPSWWKGDCDATNYYNNSNPHTNAFALGAVYRGMKACEPPSIAGGPDVWVNFGTGWSQAEWECVELSMRFLYLAFGIAPYGANGSQVVWNYGGSRLEKVSNGTTGHKPLPDDVLSYGSTSTWGHTSVVTASSVDGSGSGSITVIEQNAAANGSSTLNVSNWSVQGNAGAVSGWLHDPVNGVNLWLDPPNPTVGAEQVFSTAIRAAAGSRLVDAVDTMITFDVAKLRVVDTSGNETNQIVPGPALTTVLANTANNSTGAISYRAGMVLDGTPATGNFLVATIWFKVVASSDTTTPVQYVGGTEVSYQANSALGSVTGSTVTIRAIYLPGQVGLQGRGMPPASSWLNFPLTVGLHSGNCSNPVGSPYSVSTDASGNFNISRAPAGTYYVRVKNAHTLSNCRANVTLPAADPVEFGTLPEGDANNDDCVNKADFSLLATAYYKCEGQAGWDARADFNGDLCVKGADFSLLASNYEKCGPTTVTGAAMSAMAPQPAGDLAVAPAARLVSAGQVFTVALSVAANGQPVQAVDAQVAFDPQYLRVVDASGNETSSVEPGTALGTGLLNSVDNSQGRINYSAGQLTGTAPDGEFVLATLRLKLLAEPPSGTEISYMSGTDVFYQGASIKGALHAGGVFTLREKTYLPLLQR